MIAQLRSTWLKINASYWFWPAVFSLAAGALAITTVYLDRNGAAAWLEQFAWLHPSRPVGASNTLTVIAGSMIGVAATVFSITIAAVAYASGNYGPRLLTNFMENRGNQLSLATFISTFVYALMVLRVVRAESEEASLAVATAGTSLPGFVPQLSLLVATVMAMAAVAVLVYFLHHIPASIRISTVLAGIGRRLVHDIKHRFPNDMGDSEPRDQVSGTPVTSKDYGYVTIIDFKGLADVAEQHAATVALQLRTGDFIHPNIALAEISGTEVDDDLAERIRGCFSSGEERTPVQDLEFLIDELVEICLRALSPGINDPFTAITAMHWMSAATAELAQRDLDRGPEQSAYDWQRVQPLPDTFRHFLVRGFGAMRSAAATNTLAAKQFVDAICAAGSACHSKRRQDQLAEQVTLLLDQARHHLKGPDLVELVQRVEKYRSRPPPLVPPVS